MRGGVTQRVLLKAKITMKMSGIAHCGLKFYSNLFSFGNYNDLGTLFFFIICQNLYDSEVIV